MPYTPSKMPTPEQPLFDVEKVAPVIPAAERHAHFLNTFERTGIRNAKNEVKRAPPYLVEKLASLSTEATITISGVEIPVDKAIIELNS